MSHVSNFTQHLILFRRCVLRSLGCVLSVFLSLLYFANDLYRLLAKPLIKFLPPHSSIIATGIVSPLWIPIKFSFFVALFISMPIVLYQGWLFIAPGLYHKEKSLVWPLLLISVLLFYSGVAFSYFIVCPLFFSVIASVANDVIKVMPDMEHYLDFMIKMFFAFGFAFEIPVFMFLLIRTGVVSVNSLAKQRRYYIVIAFIVGMLLTPPDVLSQIMLAIPLYLLYEIGLLFGRLAQRQHEPYKRVKGSHAT